MVDSRYAKKFMERCTRWVVLLSVGMCIVALFAAGTTEYRSLQEKNVLIIGWDGVRRDRVQRMLDDGELPNLKKLVAQGSFVSTQVTAGETQTKPGWAEILTGYSSAKMGIYNNRNYQPIPKGYTIFERLKKHFGDAAIGTIFIGGKDYNIGARGPHEICINCLARDPITHKRTYANDIASFRNAGTIDGAPPQWVSRLGDPYFFSKDSIDVMTVGLGQAKNVAQSALAALNKYRLNKFIAFVHFEDPDEKGHLFGEQSSEYSDAIKNVDFWLGVIIKRLHGLGLSDRTSIYVTTDHGFDKGTFFHDNAPDTFLASNVRYLAASGDRLDVTPTILAGYGVDCNSFRPPLDGQSLSRDRKEERPVRIAYFHGGRVHGLYRTLINHYFEQEGISCDFYTQYLHGQTWIPVPKKLIKLKALSGQMFGRVTGRRIIDAIESGFTDGGTPGESSFIEAITRGAPIVAVALLGYDTKESPGKGLLLRSDVVINKPEDFKGRTFGTRRAGPGDKLFLCEFFKSIGLDPAKDVTIIDQLPDDAMQGYLRQRKIDGYLFHLHNGIVTIKSGLAYLYRPMNWMNPEQSFVLLVFHRDYLAQHPESVKKVLRAFMKRIRYEHSLSAKEKERPKAFGAQMTLEYKGMNLPQFKFPPLVPIDLLQDAQKLLIEYKIIDKKVDIEKFVDNRFVQEIYEEIK